MPLEVSSYSISSKFDDGFSAVVYFLFDLFTWMTELCKLFKSLLNYLLVLFVESLTIEY